jgi:hypothetical protein
VRLIVASLERLEHSALVSQRMASRPGDGTARASTPYRFATNVDRERLPLAIDIDDHIAAVAAPEGAARVAHVFHFDAVDRAHEVARA